MLHREKKWENATRKIVLMDILNAGLPQTLNLQKIQYLQKANWSALKGDTPVLPISQMMKLKSTATKRLAPGTQVVRSMFRNQLKSSNIRAIVMLSLLALKIMKQSF